MNDILVVAQYRDAIPGQLLQGHVVVSQHVRVSCGNTMCHFCWTRPSSTLTRAILEMKLQARWLPNEYLKYITATVQCPAYQQSLKHVGYLASGATPGSFSLVGDQPDVESASDASNVTDSFILVDAGDQSDAQSISDASSRSAKCFAPNTVLPGADGHLLRVEKLRIGDRVRLRDLTDVEVASIKAHRKRPYDLVQLTTRQGRFTVSKDHRVAVPGPGGARVRANCLFADTSFVIGHRRDLPHLLPFVDCRMKFARVIWGFLRRCVVLSLSEELWAPGRSSNLLLLF